MAGWIDSLRSGAWLTAARMRRVALAVLAAGIVGAGFLISTSIGLEDRLGRPLGTDFASFYAAGSLANEGRPEAAYDRTAHFAREQAIFGAATSYYSFQYPPLFLLVSSFLARMPYQLALALWQSATLALYLWSIRAILLLPSPLLFPPRRGRFGGAKATGVNFPPAGAALRAEPPSPSKTEIGSVWLLLALAFPAVLVNLGHGQNGFLTAALFGGALAQLDRRPLLAGILIGCLAYKPQFGLMMPLVLLATGRWRVIGAAAATVVALILAALIAFGPATWQAFFASMPFTRSVLLEQGGVGWHKMQSVFAWVRLWGGPVTLAYSIQAVVTVAMAVGLVQLWRSRTPYRRQAAALAIGSLLATPFCLDYDLMLLAPAIAFLAANGIARGFAPYEKTLLAMLWIVPLVARSLAHTVLIPLAVPMMLLACLLLRDSETHLARPAGGVLRKTS